MAKKLKIIGLIGLVLAAVGVSGWYISTLDIAVLSPKGSVGEKERNLMIFTVLLGCLVVIPVFIMTIVIAWKYRESAHTKSSKKDRKKPKYMPNWDNNHMAETIWWGIPIAIILVLSVVTWVSSHQLDPYKPLESSVKPVKIQVVAMNWKWLFIYPEENIATVNFIQIPVNTPVNFEITADAPMNSFWIPSLGGQIYAMAGMTTKLHLEANQIGDYPGVSSNISGEGFAGMKFTARASSQADYEAWLGKVKASDAILDQAQYNALAKPSKDNPVVYYGRSQDKLYGKILMKYMAGSQSEAKADKSTDDNQNDDIHDDHNMDMPVNMNMDAGVNH
jgi:cytochrome o ubiquinol oxidase subunit 2